MQVKNPAMPWEDAFWSFATGMLHEQGHKIRGMDNKELHKRLGDAASVFLEDRSQATAQSGPTREVR